MVKNSFEEVRDTLRKYVVHTTNVDVIEDILFKECDDKMVNCFISECGKFLTDSFTFLKEMENVPQKYRERLFNSFYGTKKTDLKQKWFKKLFKNDNTFNKHLSSHVLCVMRGFINEQKRKYNIENVKSITNKKQEELKELLKSMGYEDSILFEKPSYVDAVIGYTDCGQICYSYEKMIEYLMDEDGISYEDAAEFIDYNTVRALPYCNPSSSKPIIIYDLKL